MPMSSGVVEKLHADMAAQVAAGETPGLVAGVVRGDEVDVFCAGHLGREGEEVMRRDTIFRIASMTKPMLALVALRLVDAGVFGLDEPVGRLLPELARPRVLRRLDGPVGDTVAAERAVTVRDLLAFTAGLGVVMAAPGQYPVQAEIEAAIGAPGPPRPAKTVPADEFLARLGTLPLLHQPGAEWMYNTASDVLGVLVSRAAGASLGEVMRAYLFEPIGMRDTGFWVPPESVDRLAVSYTFDETWQVFDLARGGQFTAPPPFESGAGGLVSTLDDCLAFSRLMLGGGVFEGRRLLSGELFAEMTRDQLTPAQKARTFWVPGFFDTHGWGFGMAVRTVAGDGESVGSYGWSGGLGTAWACDPARRGAGILLTQRAMTSPVPNPVMQAFWSAATAVWE
ncbi:CubicO group peptidase (beta-lactamase class C family) [Kineosporia succinea]|uniref:CubicO group peptidase (Beta-lactamase class C family) n=2 Tax=Kineosporia succinea TaxID=84632 RepID=A0ABT9P3Y8_9ACTN|nr:CubicO group peptidase (beta-lactamase class C family) [Kineosporia succinea]